MSNQQRIFIVGAAKAGTTSLYYLLGQHPQICTPVVKEPNYFSNLDHAHDITKPGNGPGDDGTTWTSTQEAYDRLFKLKSSHHYCLDGSVSYLYSRKAAQYIHEYSPQAKIIMVLRNPVQRAWSHYKHLIRDNREEHSFEKALELEDERIEQGWEFSWHLKHMGLYSRQVERYLELFGDNIRVYLFDEIVKDMEEITYDATSFLGLPAYDYQFEDKRHNVSGKSKNKVVASLINKAAAYKATINSIIPPSVTHKLTQTIRAANTTPGDMELDKAVAQQLTEFYETDIKATATLIDRNLNHWLEGA